MVRYVADGRIHHGRVWSVFHWLGFRSKRTFSSFHCRNARHCLIDDWRSVINEIR